MIFTEMEWRRDSAQVLSTDVLVSSRDLKIFAAHASHTLWPTPYWLVAVV